MTVPSTPVGASAAHTADDPDVALGAPWHFGIVRSIPRWAGIGLFLYASIYFLSYAKIFLIPIIVAFLLAMIFGPIRRFFDRRGIPSGITSLAIVALLLFAFLSVLSALSLPVAGWIERAPELGRQIQDKLSGISETFSGVFEANQKLNQLIRSTTPNVQRVEVQGSSFATSAALFAPAIVTQFVFILILLLFLLASGDMFYEKLVHVMPTFRDKRRAMKIAHDIERKLSRYLLTITIINAGLGITIGLLLWAFGMPSPFVFGVIAFIFNFIPYLGAFAGILIASAVALVSFDWIGWAPIVGATYLTATSIEGQVVTPYFVGRSLQLNTVVVFIAVSFWAWLWSAVGMVVAVPLLVAIKTFCEHIDGLNSLGDFLSERHSEVEVDNSS